MGLKVVSAPTPTPTTTTTTTTGITLWPVGLRPQVKTGNKNVFYTMILHWRGTPFYFYDERGSHPKMKLECETQTTWTSDLIFPLWFQNWVWPPFITKEEGTPPLRPPPLFLFITGGGTPHPEIIVRDNHLATEAPGINHFHFMFLLRISAAGHWTKFVLVKMLCRRPLNKVCSCFRLCSISGALPHTASVAIKFFATPKGRKKLETYANCKLNSLSFSPPAESTWHRSPAARRFKGFPFHPFPSHAGAEAAEHRKKVN